MSTKHYFGIEYIKAPSEKDVKDAKSIVNVYLTKWQKHQPDPSEFGYEQAQRLVDRNTQNMNPQDQHQYLAELRATAKQARDSVKGDPNRLRSELGVLTSMAQQTYDSGVELRRQPDEVAKRGIVLDDLTHSTTELESFISNARRLLDDENNAPGNLDKMTEISEKLILENLKLSHMTKDLSQPDMS